MAATLTDAGELTYVSFGIEKVESTPDGDLMCYGRATDGGVDHDDQIVDPQFSSKAIRDWLESGGNIRVQHNAQRDPAGVGLEVNTDNNGATWVKSLIVEPVAKRLLAAGALRAYSVGIARPTIVRDAVAKGGKIVSGSIVEISLVDRPANARCGVQLVKSAGDGTPEYTGMVFGSDDDIAKALGGDVTKADGDDFVNVDLPRGASISISPADFAKLHTFKQQLVTKAAAADTEKRDFDRGVGGGVDRDKLPASSFAGPHRSFPIVNQSDVSDALHLAGHADDPDQVRANVKRIANREGLSVPSDSDGKNKGAEEVAGPAAEKAGNETVAVFAGDLTSEQFDAAVMTLKRRVVAEADAPEQTRDAAKEAVPDLAKSCSACSGGKCDGSSCSCGSCADGKCACGKSAGKAAGEPEPKQRPVKKAKAKKPKKMPPWLNKPADGDGDSDDSGSSCKSAADHLWTGVVGTPEIVCSKCSTTPAQAAGVTASAMDPAPVGELMESSAISVKGATPQSAGGVKDAPAMKPVAAHREPDGAEVEAFERDAGLPSDGEAPNRLEAPTLKASPEVLALLRFKSVGIDPELGRLHDLTCPAFHPDEVAKYHPFAEIGSLIDEDTWARKALDAACGPLEHAIAMQELMAAAQALKAASDADVNDWRLEAHKAFRDANPGPGTYPTPGAVSPRRYCRPLLEDGRSATSPAHSGPNTSPVVATMAPNASSFDRPPLSAGQTSPSPSFMKWDSGQYPDQQGVPTQLNYAHLEKDRQRMSLVYMHDHLSRQFPEVCPLDNVDLSGRTDRPLRGVQAEHHPVPATAGIGKGEGFLADVDFEAIAQNTVVKGAPVAAFKAEPEAGADFFADADVYKGFKKMRKKLGKKVLSGDMTVDEARAKMGRRFAQKGAAGIVALPLAPADAAPQVPVPTPLAEKSAAPAAPPAPVAASFSPEDIEAAVTKAVAPLLEKIQEQDATYTARLAEQQRVIDAIADQPDPSTAAFSGVAFQPVRKAARPAGVTDIAEAAARARRATERELVYLYESASVPAEREAYYAALTKIRGGA